MQDLALCADIQLLADKGIIKAPVTTYPLMWQSIVDDIESVDLSSLSTAERMALANVKRSMQASLKTSKELQAYGSSIPRRFTSFADNQFDKARVSAAYEYTGSYFSARLQANRRFSINTADAVNDGNSNTLDGSYLATKLGNWVLSLGAIDRWWGPGLDTSLILSSNARPLPALSLSRNNSQPFDSPWLSWIGSWSLTTQMAQLESGRTIADALLWSTRANVRPLRGLEIGFSWSYQWAGEGQPSSLRELFDAITGETECADGTQNCPQSQKSHVGNNLAGYDIRWSDTLLGLPYAVYGQMIGEDSAGSVVKITDKAFLYGVETRFSVAQQRMLLNLEYTDTQANCGPRGDTSQDCYYEHGTYRSGYRYYRRAIGSTYDNDAKTLALTLLAQLANGDSWRVKLRQADLNTNNRDLYPNQPNLGNTVAKTAQDLTQLDLQYQFKAFDGQLIIGLVYTDLNTDSSDQQDYDGYLQYRYRL